MKKQLFYLLLAAGVLSACGPAAPQLGKDSVEDVIGAMTCLLYTSDAADD